MGIKTDRILRGELTTDNIKGKLTTESTEKTLRAQREWGKESTEKALPSHSGGRRENGEIFHTVQREIKKFN
jgi:hypothetical protein